MFCQLEYAHLMIVVMLTPNCLHSIDPSARQESIRDVNNASCGADEHMRYVMCHVSCVTFFLPIFCRLPVFLMFSTQQLIRIQLAAA